MTATDRWMSADEAARHLGVSRATLYAYVSRGLLAREPQAEGGARRSRYRAEAVRRLAAQRRAARNPRQAAQATLDWGLPVLNSALTLIEDGRLYYRGQDAEALASSATLEDVAALLWAQPGPLPAATGEPGPAALRRWQGPAAAAWAPGPARSLAAWQGLMAQAPAVEAMALLGAMRAACTQLAVPPALRSAPMHRRLQTVWRLDAAQADLLRRALVLCADHELNASSFAARCVAATGAALPACVGAGLAALTGPRHGGVTSRVETQWPRWLAAARRRPALQALVRDMLAPRATASAAGASLYALGFGHPLYPGGDPRARALLAALPPDAARERLLAEVLAQTGLRPTIDVALVALRRALGLPEGAAFALFAIGRTVGWIAHALEQRAQGSLIRPRAAYVGERPVAAEAAPHGRIVRLR